ALAASFLLVGFSMTGLGFLVAWPMDSTQGFHAIMNVVLMPMWMVSGALFPLPAGNSVIGWIGALNPVTYGVAAIHQSLGIPAMPNVHMPSLGLSLFVTLGFCVVTYAASYRLVSHRKKAGQSSLEIEARKTNVLLRSILLAIGLFMLFIILKTCSAL
ncbi:MAG: ABC transporter permease, partial [Verrucomicrobiota bacterium]